MNSIFSLLAGLVALIMRPLAAIFFGPPMVVRTNDVAFAYRMGAGFPGDVNRTHPASIVPGLQNTTTPIRAYGDGALVDTASNSYKGVIAGDGSATPLNIAGVLVRPYPSQQVGGGLDASIGAAAPPVSGVVDLLVTGFIMVKIPAGQTVTKNGTPYLWCAASAGSNVQGHFTGAANSTNTVPVANARFTGPADADGNVEIEVWAAR